MARKFTHYFSVSSEDVAPPDDLFARVDQAKEIFLNEYIERSKAFSSGESQIPDRRDGSFYPLGKFWIQKFDSDVSIKNPIDPDSLAIYFEGMKNHRLLIIRCLQGPNCIFDLRLEREDCYFMPPGGGMNRRSRHPRLGWSSKGSFPVCFHGDPTEYDYVGKDVVEGLWGLYNLYTNHFSPRFRPRGSPVRSGTDAQHSPN